jgi:hypothetical protein
MLTLGADIVQRPDPLASLAVVFETASADAFASAISADFQGTVAGPYVAWLPRPDLLVDAWLGYVARDVDTGILDYGSRYDASPIFLSANATGRYALGGFEALPRHSLFLPRDGFDGHRYTGPSGPFDVPGGTDDIALQRFAADLRRMLNPRADGTILIPAARLGIDVWLTQPEDDEVYSATLGIEDTDAVIFRIGVRISALAPNGGRYDLTLDYARGSGSLARVEGNLAYVRRF